jgi:hypothetical protein
MELARFELATSWVRSIRNSFPLVAMLRHLASLRAFRQSAFAVLRHASSWKFDHHLTTAKSHDLLGWGDLSFQPAGAAQA